MTFICSQFVIGALLSYLIVTMILPFLRNKFIDTPNQRSSHNSPTPRGGGIAIVITVIALSFIFFNETTRWITIYCMPLALIGIIDDFRSVSAPIRYIVQIFTACALIYVARIDIALWEIPFYIFSITAIINFINFTDGLDGIVAGCSVPLFLAASSWSTAGAIFGFLIWNWSPAKVFMGDVGSTFIGALFAGFALQEAAFQDMISLLLLGFPLFGDAGVTIFRRFIHNDNIFDAHKQHLFQRLNQAGWNHANVAILYIFAVLLLVLIRAYTNFQWLLLFVVIEFLLGVFLDRSVAAKFTSS